MISSQKEDHLGVLNLICHEQAHRLNALLSAIDEITNQQEFVDRWRASRDLKQPQHVVELAVEVAGDFDWRL